MKRFIDAKRHYVDLEDRALYLVQESTHHSPRWLTVRLDFMGGVLVLFVALLAVTDVSGINAAQIGPVLMYTIMLSLMCGMVTRQTADVENNMNAVERLAEYLNGKTIPQEAPHEIEAHKPLAQWPEHGAIEFKDVKMAYRPVLPNVLMGISKIGVVGRTGAGKSLLMLAFVDISTIGLKDLRSRISIIPQGPLLFSGRCRSFTCSCLKR
ncbi:multidrug resistance-associated protein member 3 [Suillus clintonianus]|uniref:multidrug resistance-associated protein member 3 n=1 Tax=Suillus clintonianus TaxID=1904413 RepID=UPI001B85BC84|nr:multidrug resistance-associated protein member 3 [Suillus clintonianus]KAG2112765.1 multidrug resistance-associated protein member 3 [Suillus clintonianus]